MPEDNPNPNPLPPRSQPNLNSLDGFTNAPRPPVPHPAGNPPNNDISKPVVSPPGVSPNNMPQNHPMPGSSIGIGGVAKPTVTGLPATPYTPAPTVSGQTTTPATAPVIMKKKSKKKLWLFLIVLLVLLLLGAGYVFAIYLPNTPSNVYKSSLENTGLAVDKLIDYSSTQQKANYKSVAIDGKLNVKSPAASFDTTLNANLGDTNGQLQATGDFMGTHVKADVRYVTKSGNTSPDVYLQVSGVKAVLNSAGLGSLAKLDSQWIVIDHTLVDTYSSSLKKMAQQSSGSDVANANKSPTYAQVQDAIKKVQVVNKQYLFTADSSNAVLTNEQYIGEETLNGQTVYHYKVGYNKDHLQAYVTAVGQALDSSQLNDWSKQANKGKNISEVMDLKSLNDQIKNGKGDYTFDMWADKHTKLISKLAFTDQKDKSSVVSISQNYTGGVVYPFSIGIASKDSSGNPQNATIGFTVNSSTQKVGFTVKADTKDSSGTTTVDGSFTMTPGNDSVTVTAPTGAKPIMDILKSLGLGSILTPPAAAPVTSPKTGTICNEPSPACLL